MRIKILNLISNTGLFLFSITITFLVGEIVMRFSDLNHVYDRSLMFSSKTFLRDQNGAIRYQPNENIRTVAVYNNKIEYDVHFDTNNLGFVDEEDYAYENNPNKRYYAFVGDSFTAGFHGGEPWVPKLRGSPELKHAEIFNLGVGGTGIKQFEKLLKSAKKQLHFTDIVILAISEDFIRRVWYPFTTFSEIRFCPEDIPRSSCIEGPYTAKIIDPTSSSEDILKVAANKNRDSKVYGDGIIDILGQSELFTFVDRSLRKISRKKIKKNRTPFSVDSLRNIREAFPLAEIHFIHLPQKQEVIAGQYVLKNIGNKIEQVGISYYSALEECDWQTDMFFVNDSHPNNIGYDNIKSCVSNYLFR